MTDPQNIHKYSNSTTKTAQAISNVSDGQSSLNNLLDKMQN